MAKVCSYEAILLLVLSFYSVCYKLGWLPIYYANSGLEHLILLPLPPKFWSHIMH